MGLNADLDQGIEVELQNMDQLLNNNNNMNNSNKRHVVQLQQQQGDKASPPHAGHGSGPYQGRLCHSQSS